MKLVKSMTSVKSVLIALLLFTLFSAFCGCGGGSGSEKTDEGGIPKDGFYSEGYQTVYSFTNAMPSTHRHQNYTLGGRGALKGAGVALLENKAQSHNSIAYNQPVVKMDHAGGEAPLLTYQATNDLPEAWVESNTSMAGSYFEVKPLKVHYTLKLQIYTRQKGLVVTESRSIESDTGLFSVRDLLIDRRTGLKMEWEQIICGIDATVDVQEDFYGADNELISTRTYTDAPLDSISILKIQ